MSVKTQIVAGVCLIVAGVILWRLVAAASDPDVVSIFADVGYLFSIFVGLAGVALVIGSFRRSCPACQKIGALAATDNERHEGARGFFLWHHFGQHDREYRCTHCGHKVWKGIEDEDD